MACHRRGPWSNAEDAYLMQLVQTHGPLNWVRIAQTLGSRTPKQCRERYHQNLKPNLNHDPITPEEGLQIERLVHEIGKRWAEIARRLHGRSDNAVKNWWNGSQNRKKRLDRRRAVHPSASYDDVYPNSPATMAPMGASPNMSLNSSQAHPQHGYSMALDAPRHAHHRPMPGHWTEAPLPSPCSSEPTESAADSDAGSNYVTSPGRTARTLQPIELPPLRTWSSRSSGGEAQLPSLSSLASPAPSSASSALSQQRRLPPLGTKGLPTAPNSPVQQLGKPEASPVDRDSRMNVSALLG